MRSLLLATALICLGLAFAGCSTDNAVVSPVGGDEVAMTTIRGEGEFALEAKYTYFRGYPTGNALYIIRLLPGPDFTGDVSVNVSADKKLNAELSVNELNAANDIVEIVLNPTRQVAYGYHTVTVTVSNQTHQESVDLDLDLWDWGILSMNRAVDTREQFIDWLEIEHPELGNLGGEQWEVYSTYPGIKIVEHYTHLSDNWEFRVCCHISWGTDIFKKMWLRPRGEWDAILAVEYFFDDITQEWVTQEMDVSEYPIYFGY